MKKAEWIEKQVRETLDLLDRGETMEAGPFFAARIGKRIRSLHAQEAAAKPRTRLRRVLAPGFLALIVVLNLFSLVLTYRSNRRAEPTKQDYLVALAEDYSIRQDSTLYDSK
jgi:hypothetical protein